MSEIDQVRNDLIIANRVLALENVVDAYGHVSVRHPARPDRFFLSRSRSPQLVGASDILEFTLDGKVVGDDDRSPYLERFIHAAIYEARPEVNAVVHAHAEDTQEVVQTAVYLPRNARVQMAAMRLGDIDPLSFNEIEVKRSSHRRSSPESWRAWEYWAHRAGCAELLGKPPR
jgi:ribulose-5-phosphate 4-epimerase/fuculose-1-phosphate aldolase